MKNEEMYRALFEKDPTYDGLFYTGVTTTGIFCRCVCTARKPKRENVLFYCTVNDAMAAGFRPCKICRPMEALVDIDDDEREVVTKIFLKHVIEI